MLSRKLPEPADNNRICACGKRTTNRFMHMDPGDIPTECVEPMCNSCVRLEMEIQHANRMADVWLDGYFEMKEPTEEEEQARFEESLIPIGLLLQLADC